jgi:hypothetical protein
MTMKGHDIGPQTSSEVPLETLEGGSRDEARRSRWEARQQLDWHRAETERLRVLVDFLARPIHAHGGADPDPDIVTAYNLAVEAALQGIRNAARGDS